jgi:hypothetical protein
VAFSFPSPDHLPCPDCGASISVDAPAGAHVCDAQRRVDYQQHVSAGRPETQSGMASEFPPYEQQVDDELSELRTEIDRFDDDLAAWLDTPEGRFSQWLAARDR